MPIKLKKIFLTSLALAFIFCNHSITLSADDEIARIIAGSNKIFSTRAPTRVLIGNPNIADVVDVTQTEITVNGKNAGTTNLVYWDAYGEQSVKIKVLAEDVEAIKERVDGLLKKLELTEVYSRIEEDEAKVLLLGRVKTQQDKDRIQTALCSLKDKVVDLTLTKEDQTVIEIDVQILELNKDASDTLGFTWPGSIDFIEKGSMALTAGGTSWANLWKVAAVQRGTGLGASPFTMKMDMLIQEGKARILSRPRLSCQSGKEAKLVVGGEVPVLSSSVSGGGTTEAAGAAQPGNVEYKEYGIILEITPDIEGYDRMHLKLNVEVSDVAETAVKTDYALAYPLTKRTATTELFLNDGETMAIGGLIKQKTEEDLRKFPWLADVPVLGSFFRQRVTKQGGGATKRGDTELFIVLTPKIVARDVPKIKEEEKPKVQALSQEEAFAKSEIPKNLVNYSKAVQIKILRAIYYPRIAKDAGWEGNVKLALRIGVDGKLLEQKITQSSGYKVLDDAAVSVAMQQSPYPPFPPQIESQEVWVEVPVVFRKD